MASSKLRMGLIRAAFSLSVIAMVAIPVASANAHTVAAIKKGGNLVVDPSPVSSWIDAFNPAFSGSNVYGILGLVYEPLVFYNGETGKPTPWLASSLPKWSNGGKTLTYTIRKNVKWNDGKKLTAADVVYSAHLAQKYPAFDKAGMDPFLKSVTSSGQKVSFNFKSINSTLSFYIGFNMLVLPQHIWSKIKNPVTWTDPKPVATGPFMLGSFSPEQYVLVKNKHYWQKGKPYLASLTFPAYSSNNSAEADIINGKTDWAGIFIENAAHNYVGKAPGNHFWFNPANQPAALYTNDAEQPFSNVWVRRAITEAVNRNQVWKQGEYGYEPPSNAGFIQPQFAKTWGNPSVMKMLNPKGNVKLAKADLKKAMKNKATAAALKSKTLSIIVVSGWTDWDASVGIIASELKSIGINAVENQIDFNTYNSDLNLGKFDMGMSWTYSGPPNPYPIYKYGFGGQFYVKPGKDSAGFDRERYKNPALDKLITQFSTSIKKSEQIKIMKQMEAIVAKDVPIVPLVTQALWYEYNTAKFTGFPTQSHPYEIGSPYSAYWEEDVALHVHLK